MRLSVYLIIAFLGLVPAVIGQVVSGQDTTEPSRGWTISLEPDQLPGHLSALLDELNRAVEAADPERADSLELQLAFGLYLSKQYELAKVHFTTIFEGTRTSLTVKEKMWAELGLALIRYDLLDHSGALTLLLSCRNKFDERTDPKLKFYVHHYSSLCYVNLGMAAQAESEINRALSFAPPEEIPMLNNEQVRILATLGRTDEARELAEKNLELFKAAGKPLGICIGYTTLGVVALSRGEDEKAREYWLECFDLARRERQFDAMVWISRNLAGYYKRSGNAALALQYMEFNSAYKDSLSVQNTRLQMTLEAARSRTLQKQMEIQILTGEKEQTQLKLQRNRTYLMMILLVFILVLLVLLALRYRDKVREHRLMLELNRVRLNPHFIFNSLNSLQKSMIQGDFETSNRYLTRFAGLMREILDQSIEPFIPLNREISFLNNYLELENLRFSNRFTYSVEIPEAIDCDEVSIPSMLIQPTVENSIWHGLLPLDRPGTISLRFSWKVDGRLLQCEVEDNGIGRTEAQRQKAGNTGPFTSRGTGILKNRIGLMKKLYHSECNITYSDITGPDGTVAGTRVFINLPVKSGYNPHET